MRENATHMWGLLETNEAATKHMSSLSWLPSGESSFNIYELLSMKANLLIKRSLKKKMAHK